MTVHHDMDRWRHAEHRFTQLDSLSRSHPPSDIPSRSPLSCVHDDSSAQTSTHKGKVNPPTEVLCSALMQKCVGPWSTSVWVEIKTFE